MPRQYPPRRTHVAFRMSAPGLDAVDALAAAETGGDRSAMLRTLIAEALAARATRTARRR